jgi:hypothetical protein
MPFAQNVLYHRFIRKINIGSRHKYNKIAKIKYKVKVCIISNPQPPHRLISPLTADEWRN